MHRLLLFTAVAVAVALVAACGSDDRPRSTPWTEGTTHGPWRTVYTGYGHVEETGGVITLSPAPARSPEITHAALVTTSANLVRVDASLAVRTTRQLRRPTPNPWEVGWVVWNYTDDDHFYYLALKPNGWEIGKEDPAYPGAQRYLATGPQTFTLDTWHTVTVRQTAASFTVTANGTDLATITDTEKPYPSGRFGLYTEDATVEFRPLRVPLT